MVSEDRKINNEGDIFCRWLYSRMIKQNKNVLGAELGSTGSGKSYRDLRKAELWYRYRFNKEFPVENICFGIPSVIERINSKELKRGEVLIFEEAGANLGSLDFHNKIQKMFTYVLQSFRSMNIGIFFNLPYLSMLNKSARLLLHYSSESVYVDKTNKINYCRFYAHQVNQKTGKLYQKWLRIRVNNTFVPVRMMAYTLPSKYLQDAYEEKKKEFLERLTGGYHKEIIRKNYEDMYKERHIHHNTDVEKIKLINKLLLEGNKRIDIASQLNILPSAVSGLIRTGVKHGIISYETAKVKRQKEIPKSLLKA